MESADIDREILSAIEGIRGFLTQQAELGITDLPKGEGSSLSEASGADLLGAFHDSIRECRKCRLFEGRRVVVFGSGHPDADLMFIGEAPGREEDRQGAPFVGAAGELLTRMIESIGLSRDEVYIANIIKCRPPGNRDPEPDEVESCEPYLARQIELIKPQVICTLGRFAAQALLKTTESMGRLRGQVFTYEGIKLIPIYHPAALLRNSQWKRPTWEDLKRVRKEYDGREF